MAPRGPKPQPAAVKKAKGNPGRRRLGEDEVLAAPVSSGIAPPEWLKGEALEVWEQRAPSLARMRLLGPTDAAAFARYCRNFARWLKMQRLLDDAGETYVTESAHGTMRRLTPEFMAADRLERALCAAEDRFGLNPAERQRIMAARASLPSGGLFGEDPPPSPKGAAQPAATTDGEHPKGPSPIGMLQ